MVDAVSLTAMKLVPQELLQDRLEVVKELQEGETETYAIQKDRHTGEHYLHYAYIHLDIASGNREMYHYLMPLSNDELLTILFEKQPYQYPDHWHGRFLRNGPIGQYVWFDPAGVESDPEDTTFGDKLTELLTKFKEKGQYDKQSIRQLLNEIDKFQ